MTKLRHYDKLGTVRFVTFSCYHRYRLFVKEHVIRIFLSELDLIRIKYDLKLLGYVVMPEHVHLVLWPPDDVRLGRVIGELKFRSARKILKLSAGQRGFDTNRLVVEEGDDGRILAFWQRRCYDHNCRSSETVLEKIEYCHKNPVTRGLVSDQNDWLWSSYLWYQGETDVPLAVDDMES